MTTTQVPLGFILSRTLRSIFYPQILILFILPFLISIAVVCLGLWLTWDFWFALFHQGLTGLQPYWIQLLNHSPSFLQNSFAVLSIVSSWVLILILLALAFPVVILLNLVLVSTLANTYLVQFVAQKFYPELQKKGHSRFLKSLINTFSASLIYLFLCLITLPFWMIPQVGGLIYLILMAWLNQKICTFEALTEFSSDDELTDQKKLTSSNGFRLGFLMALLNYIPFGFFISPIITMIAFTHLSLTSLQNSRSL